MSRRSSTSRISLFPFLAVLLCAMGALIVLLVVLARQIREQVVRSDNAPTKQIVPEVVVAPRPSLSKSEPIESIPKVVFQPPPVIPVPHEDPNVELRAQRAETEARLGLLQEEVSHCHDELAAKRLAFESATRTAILEGERTAKDKNEFVNLHGDIESLRSLTRDLQDQVANTLEKIEDARKAQASAPAQLQIVPYDGLSGTARHPILIECTEDAIRFLPEDIALTPDDLTGFRPRYNPLLAGANALRNYWRVQSDTPGENPYVLLLVRENGIVAYYAARSLLEELGEETGYELIPAGEEIAIPKLDPLAQKVCHDAVRDALELRLNTDFPVGNDAGQFEGNQFRVQPGEHDPTRSPKQKTSLYPVKPRSTTPGRSRQQQPSFTSNELREGRHTKERQGSNQQDVPGELVLQPAPRKGLLESFEGDPLEAPMTLPPPGDDVIELNSPRDQQKSLPRDQELKLLERPRHGAQPTRLGEQSSGDAQSTGEQRWGESPLNAIISLERTIRVTISDDRIQVGDQPAITLGEEAWSEHVQSAVVKSLHAEARTWGPPPESFFWTPRVRAVVSPGGEYTFTQLRQTLKAMDVPVDDQIALNESANTERR